MCPNVNTDSASKGKSWETFFSKPQFDNKLLIIVNSLQNSLRSQESNCKSLSVISCIVDTDISMLLIL